MLSKSEICDDCPWCEQTVKHDEAQQLIYHGNYPEGWFHRHHAACIVKEKQHWAKKEMEKSTGN
jgi:hypothetical protein